MFFEMNVYVTKSFLPPIDEYCQQLKKIWERGIITNQGHCVKELEQKLCSFLGVNNLHYVTNGTVALQLALSSLDIHEGEIITTPFSYVATMGSILWERCDPVFVDIEPNNFMIDPNKIEKAITPRTKAILAVHVFGYACDTYRIQTIAESHDLKVIYDGAHAFASRYKGRSLLSYGDISTCSFHATKLFHTVEGGACIVKDKRVSDILELQKRFGHNNDNFVMLGINAKQSELHAAMGLVNFNHIAEIINLRKKACDLYDKLLEGIVFRPKPQEDLEYNYAYYPIVFKSEHELMRVFERLRRFNIFPRRYFYPSLNTMQYLKEKQKCPISEDISSRIACLPLYVGIDEEIINTVCEIIRTVIDG